MSQPKGRCTPNPSTCAATQTNHGCAGFATWSTASRRRTSNFGEHFAKRKKHQFSPRRHEGHEEGKNKNYLGAKAARNCMRFCNPGARKCKNPENSFL